MAKQTSKKTSLKDIAEKVGVSPSLVSFVLNGRGKEFRVKNETIDNIMKVVREMNYQPNIMARGLRSGKSRCIGVILSDISNQFFAHIARGIIDVAAKSGYTVFLGSSDEQNDKLDDLVTDLLNRGIDGLIIVPCEGSDKTIKSLQSSNTPILLFDRHFEGISSVTLNNYRVSKKAVEHLVKQGYKRIGMLAYDINLSHMQERILGYKDAIKNSGQQEEIIVRFASSDTSKLIDKSVKKLLSQDVDAIFCATNNISTACLMELKKANIYISSDFGFMGFDGTESFDLFYTPIDYVKQPIASLTQKTVDVIIELIETDSTVVQCIQIDGELVIKNR